MELSTKTGVLRGSFTWLRNMVSRPTRTFAVPAGNVVYAVGDIHGRCDLLQQMLERIKSHALNSSKTNTLIFLGDYIDRGPDSKGVIDLLVNLHMPQWDIRFIRGNHDQSLLHFLEDPLIFRIWRGFGAQETLLSYGVMPPRFDDPSAFLEARDALVERLPQLHLNFLQQLEYSVTKGDYVFVHAGLRPGLSLGEQTPEDMMWIREDFLLSDYPFDKLVVHGHTPTERPVRRPNRIGIDTGAHATGRLTATILCDDRCEFLTTTDIS